VDVVIVASAFGADLIRCDGHAAWAEVAAKSGAAGFEVRRELFDDKRSPTAESLDRLGAKIRALGMWSVFSTPATLFSDDGQLDNAVLEQAIQEAKALGAHVLKMPLGGTEHGVATDNATLERLTTSIRKSKMKVLVENGQLRAGGTIAAFVELFASLTNHPNVLKMTFDTGNWLWVNEDPKNAARSLEKYVSYVHCKDVRGHGARRFAAAPSPDDSSFLALLSALPNHVPRGIEFPFNASSPETDARRYVHWLAAI